jgi:hypothetical protein
VARAAGCRAQPERVEAPAAGFEGVERGELEIADAPGERFARLPEQVDRRRAEGEEAALAAAPPPAGVDQPSQALEELRRALDLVEDDELVVVLREVELGLGKLGAIGLGLEVEIDRRALSGDLERQRGLASLTRAEERNRRDFVQG